jgi:hypothetical protein
LAEPVEILSPASIRPPPDRSEFAGSGDST